MPIEDIITLKDLGAPLVSLIVLYWFARWAGDKAFVEIERANKRADDTHQRFVAFIENAYEEHTKTMNKLCDKIDNLREDIIDRKQVPKEYR